MKKLLNFSGTVLALILFGLTFLNTSPANAQTDFKVGVGPSFNTQSPLALGSGGDIGIQGAVLAGFSESIRTSADFSFYFPSDGSKWTLNANLHWVFLNKSSTNIYLIAGYNYFTTTYDVTTFGGGTTEQSTTTSGINLGTGLEFSSGFGNIYFEPKYVVGLQAGFVGSAGLRFGL